MAHTRPRGFLKDTLTLHSGPFWVSTVLLSKWNGTCAQEAPGRHYVKLFWTHIARTLKYQMAHTRPRGVLIDTLTPYSRLFWMHIALTHKRALWLVASLRKMTCNLLYMASYGSSPPCNTPLKSFLDAQSTYSQNQMAHTRPLQLQVAWRYSANAQKKGVFMWRVKVSLRGVLRCLYVKTPQMHRRTPLYYSFECI